MSMSLLPKVISSISVELLVLHFIFVEELLDTAPFPLSKCHKGATLPSTILVNLVKSDNIPVYCEF